MSRRPAPGASGTVVEHLVAAGRPDRHAGEGAAELLGGPAGAHHGRPQPVGRSRTGSASRRPAGRTSGRPATGAAGPERQRPGAGRAPGRGAAARAGQRRDVAAPRHLDEHRPGRRACRAVSQADRGQPGGPGGRVAGQVGVLPPATRTARRRGPHRGARAGPGGPSPSRHQRRGLGRAGEPADQQRRPVELRARRREHLAHVRVRRARLGVQVVAVVPDRRPGRGPRPGRTSPPGCRRPPARRRARRRRKRAVALGRAELGGQRDVAARAADLRRARREPATSRCVGHDDERAAPGGERRRDRGRELVRPRRSRAAPSRPRGGAAPAASARRKAAPGGVADPSRLGLVGACGGAGGSGGAARPARPRPARAAAGRPAAARRRACPRTGRRRPGPARRPPGVSTGSGETDLVAGGPSAPARGRTSARPARARSRRRAGRRSAPAPGRPARGRSASAAGTR